MEAIEKYDGGHLGTNIPRLLETVLSLPHNCHLVDLGVRLGVSSRIMLTEAAQRNNHVHGVEAIGCAVELADILSLPNYHFISGDSVTTGLKWDKKSVVALVMFDTFHFAEHILCELYAWWPHIAPGGWCVFHDTNWPQNQHDVYAGKVLPHAIEGVIEFFKEIPFVTHPNNYGMTFVQKPPEDDLINQIPIWRWDEVFGVRREVMKAVNLPITWEDQFQ